jgi:high-affinity iron transporter
MIADIWMGGLIGFREALEATLIVVIFMLILKKSARPELMNSIWKGVGLGIVASILTTIAFEFFIGGFAENEAWFEGVLMLVSAGLIAIVVFHLIKHHSKSELEKLAKDAVSDLDGGAKALSIIAFLSVWREGAETVIFMSTGTETNWAILGLFIGICAAVFLGWLIQSRGVEVNVKKFFTATTILLIFVGAGLAGHGVHELQDEDAGIIPVYNEEIWDVNPEWDGTGNAPVMHDKGAIGGMMRAMVGWNGDPTMLEFFTWMGYLSIMGILYKRDTDAHSPAEESEPFN